MMRARHLFDNRPLAESMLSLWRHDEDDPHRFENFRISASAVYPFHLEGERQYLRFAPATEKTEDGIRAELDFILYLRANGYPALEPIPSRDGRDLVTAETEWGTYHATAFKQVAGVPLEDVEISIDIAERYGSALGRLHHLSSRYVPPGPKRWSHGDVLRWIVTQVPGNAEVAAEADLLLGYFAMLPREPSTYGLVHDDFEPDNVFFERETGAISVIDFDSSMYHWYLADLDHTLHQVPDDKREAFLAGYRSQFSVDLEAHKAMAPLLGRFVDLKWYAKAHRTIEEILPEEPDWVLRMRARIAPMLERRSAAFGTPLDHP